MPANGHSPWDLRHCQTIFHLQALRNRLPRLEFCCVEISVCPIRAVQIYRMEIVLRFVALNQTINSFMDTTLSFIRISFELNSSVRWWQCWFVAFEIASLTYLPSYCPVVSDKFRWNFSCVNSVVGRPGPLDPSCHLLRWRSECDPLILVKFHVNQNALSKWMVQRRLSQILRCHWDQVIRSNVLISIIRIGRTTWVPFAIEIWMTVWK